MKRYLVRLAPEAEADLVGLHAFIVERSGSAVTADRYLEPGLRLVGFERSVSVAFIVEEDDVVVLRVLPGGEEFIP